MNRHSPFHEVTQYLMTKYLEKPYPDGTARRYHGSLHAVMTVLAADMLIALIEKHYPKEKSLLKVIHHDPELLELFRYGVFCHDIGNTSENDRDTESHAKIYTEEMTALGYDPVKIEIIANVMREKDNKENTSILRRILHDADALEYLRVLPDIANYKREELTLSSLSKKVETTINEIVLYYHHLCRVLNVNYHQYINQTTSNRFLTIKKYISAFYLWAELQPELITGPLAVVDLRALTRAPDFDLSILDLYHRNVNPTFQKKFYAWLSQEDKTENVEPALQLFRDQHLYLRHFSRSKYKPNPIDVETATLEHNRRIRKEEKFADANELKKHIENKPPKGIHVRPATIIRNSLSVATYDPNSLFVLLDPNKVNATHFYKENVESNNLVKRNFYFMRPERIKLLESDKQLIEKLEENEARRRGQKADNYLKHLGKQSSRHNEVWLDYNYSAVTGIGVTHDANTAKDALRLRMEIFLREGQIIPFYSYHHLIGLQHISVNEVVSIALKEKIGLDTTSRLQQLTSRNITINEADFNVVNNPGSFYNITSTLRGKEPTKNTPVGFNMQIVGLTKTYLASQTQTTRYYPAKAYFIDQFPVIEYTAGDKTHICLDTKNHFANIAAEYEHDLILKCNKALAKLKMNLKIIYSVKDASFDYIRVPKTNKTPKNVIVLRVRTFLDSKHVPDGLTQMLTDLLGYNNKHLPDDISHDNHLDFEATEKMLTVKIRENQLLESIYQRLSRELPDADNDILMSSERDKRLELSTPLQRFLSQVYDEKTNQIKFKLTKISQHFTEDKQASFHRVIEALIDMELFASCCEILFFQNPEFKSFECVEKMYLPVCQMAKEGDFVKLANLLRLYQGKPFEMDSNSTGDALLYLAKAGRKDIIKQIYAKSSTKTATGDKQDDYGTSALHYAVKANDPELFQLIASRTSFYSDIDDFAMSPLSYWLHPTVVSSETLIHVRAALNFRQMSASDDKRFQLSEFLPQLLIVHHKELPGDLLAEKTLEIYEYEKNTFTTFKNEYEDEEILGYLLMYILLFKFKNPNHPAEETMNKAIQVILSDDEYIYSNTQLANGDTPLHLILNQPEPDFALFKQLMDRNEPHYFRNEKFESIEDLAKVWARKGRPEFYLAICDKNHDLNRAIKRNYPEETRPSEDVNHPCKKLKLKLYVKTFFASPDSTELKVQIDTYIPNSPRSPNSP